MSSIFNLPDEEEKPKDEFLKIVNNPSYNSAEI